MGHEQLEILIHSVCFAERKTLGIPFRALPRKIRKLGREKHSELRNFVPNKSTEDENTRNSIPNHFIEEKKSQNFVISFSRITWKIKMLGFHSKSFRRREKYSEFRSKPLIRRKNFWKLVANHSRTKKHNTRMTIKKFSVLFQTSEWADRLWKYI